MSRGQILSIFRERQLVGKIRVENVYDDMCSAVILKDLQRVNHFKQGDSVRFLPS